MSFDREHVRAYLERPWGLLERTRDETWGDEIRARGPERAVALSWALREHLQAMNPEWPTDEDRRQDYEDHVRLRRLLDRASAAMTGQPEADE